MKNSNVILKVNNLKKYYPIKKGLLQRTVGNVKAVDGINLDVRKGETLSIVGEAGCGKSTTGRTIIRLYEPTSGEIIYKGKNISNLPERHLKKIIRKEMQMIFQDPYASLNSHKTIGNILIEPLNSFKIYENKKERLERVKELLEIVGLNSGFTNHYPHEFSGGQRQRIGIARALALNPELIIADEPVSALDVSIQAQIINLLIDLQEQFKLTYIFISHDLSVVRHISDRIVVMYLGKVMEIADKESFFTEPLHPYSKALLSAVPTIKGEEALSIERIVLKGELPNPSNPPKGCVFHTRCPFAIDKCKQVEPDLEKKEDDRLVACHLYE